MRTVLTYCFLVYLSVCTTLPAQNNVQYSQYMFNALLFNPAYAGSHDALNVTALYRSQWTSVAGAPKGISASAHAPLKNKKINFGVSVENEEIGLYDHTQVNLIYAYRMRLGAGKLSFGIKGGFDSRKLRQDALSVNENDDPVLYGSVNPANVFVSGAGAYYSTPKYYVGVAAPSLAGGLPGHMTLVQLHGGMIVILGDHLKVKPALLVRRQKESPLYANVSALFYYKEIIGLGGGYAYQNNWLLMIDLKLNDQLNFGYAYDNLTAPHSTFKAGSHEVMLRYLFRYRISSVNPRFF